MSSAPIPVETLLAHREWVRAVAVAVVRDPNAADDVEQETWLAALSSPPRHASSLRGWFGAVARSRARRIGRTESRRDARESAGARREPTQSAAELAETADTHRRVVQAVVELPEPYRETILLRYFEGLGVDEVAARTSVPLDTARSRISRGLAKLRERLSKELGTDDRPWALALAPLIAAPKGTGAGATAAGGGVVMASTKTMAAVAGALLLVGIGAVVVPKWTSDAPRDVASAPPAQPAKPIDDASTRTPASTPRVQRPRAKDEAPAPAPAEPKARETEETVSQKLDRVRISLDQNSMQVLDALAEFAARAGVEVAISEEADARGIRGVSTSSHLEDVSGKTALKTMTKLLGFDYVIEEPRVVIVPKGVSRNPAKPLIVLPPWTPPTPITVVGRVTDADGSVVVGAEVVHVRGGERVVATTDIAGRFEVKLTKPYGSLQARAPWQLASLVVAVTGEPAAQTTLDLATRGRAGALVVRVDAGGSPLDRTPVTLAPLPAGAPPGAGVLFTDGKGVATFQGVAPGDATATVKQPGFETVTANAVVEAGKAVEVAIHLVKKAPLSERIDKARVTVNVTEMSVHDVVSYFMRVTNVNIVLSPALMETSPRKIALNLSDVSLTQALNDLCTQIGATFETRDDKDVVWIVPAKR